MKEVQDVFPDYFDGEFLDPKSGAKLASLFDLDQTESQGNESFQFTAPKQPKKSSTATGRAGPPSQKPAPPMTAPAVLLAAGVHAFCFVDGQYVNRGKLGSAVLGNHLTKEYTLLLYGSQQKHIATARIHPAFDFTVQPGNYTTFYDDQRQNWSLKFDSEKAGLDFCREVCLARWNSQACMDTLVTQDLLQGEGQAVDVGDRVEVAFTGWLLQNYTVGQMFDSNMGKNKLQRVKLGSKKTHKGWEEGMVGMRKGGRRLLIIPPSMGNGTKNISNCVPSASTLVFDVVIHQVKFFKEVESLNGGSKDSVCGSLVPDLENSSVVGTIQTAACASSQQGDQVLQVTSGPLKELPKHSDAAKAKLTSRMDKMDQPILPSFKGAIPAQPDPSDSETEPLQMASKPPSCAVSSKPVQFQPTEHNAAGFLEQVNVSSGQVFQPHAPSQLHHFTSAIPPHPFPHQATDINSYLVKEACQQTTEIQQNIDRLADRLDQLVSKVDDIQEQGFCSLGLTTASLETAIILHNIQRIIQENASLKKEVLEKASKVEEQNCKIGDLIEQRQRYIEQSSLLMEQKNYALQNSSQHNHTRLLQAEQEKMRFAEELSSSTSRLCELQDEAVRHQQRASELQAKLGAALEESRWHATLVSSLQAQVEELNNEGEQSRQQWRTQKQKCRKMESTVKIMEEEIHDLKAEKDMLEKMLTDKKKKWQLDRQNLLMAQEEQRRSSEEENLQLLQQLMKLKACSEMHNVQQVHPVLQERNDAAAQEETPELKGVNIHLQEQVKQVMNELFNSLREQFDLQESYTGDSVLRILLMNIKSVTMKILREPQEEKLAEEVGADG